VVNHMQVAGIIGSYAIGGAVGATFYLEPSATLDVDIFILLPPGPGGPLTSLSPIYEFLTAQGCQTEAEHVVIGDWPVQFLVASNELEEEAVAQATATEVDGVPTFVMKPEHLIAIALRTGRFKDHNRILQFLEHQVVDLAKLKSVLSAHGLESKWEQFQRRYLAESNETEVT
jgi:hypothetical protein